RKITKRQRIDPASPHLKLLCRTGEFSSVNQIGNNPPKQASRLSDWEPACLAKVFTKGTTWICICKATRHLLLARRAGSGWQPRGRSRWKELRYDFGTATPPSKS